GEGAGLPLSLAEQGIRVGGLARGRLVHGPEDQDIAAKPRRNCAHGVEDRTILPWRLAAAPIPAKLEAQRVLESGAANGREARTVGALPRPCCESIDVRAAEAGVGNGLECRIDRERQR